MVSSLEAEKLPRMAEIRFDCMVRMFDMESRVVKTGVFGHTEKPLRPQWFVNECKITLETIKYGSEYEIGRTLKDMLYQLEDHMEKYKKNKL
jgi:hypothetical protein